MEEKKFINSFHLFLVSFAKPTREDRNFIRCLPLRRAWVGMIDTLHWIIQNSQRPVQFLQHHLASLGRSLREDVSARSTSPVIVLVLCSALNPASSVQCDRQLNGLQSGRRWYEDRRVSYGITLLQTVRSWDQAGLYRSTSRKHIDSLLPPFRAF